MTDKTANKETIQEIFQKIKKRYQELYQNGAHRKNLAENDIVTKVDKEITQVVTEYFQEKEQQFHLLSEELNKKENANNGKEEKVDYTVIVDEIDGTHNLHQQNGDYGPIIAIVKGLNPEFKDVKAVGYLNLAKNTFYEAYKGKGAYKTTEWKAEPEKIQTSQQEKLEKGSKTSILVDQGMIGKQPEIARKAWKHWCNDYGSQAQHFAMIAEGDREIFITGGHSYLEAKPENTAEELAGMYLLVKEAGGQILNWNGEKIREEKIGMKEKKNHDIIAAANHKLAQKAVKTLVPEKYNK